MLRSMENNAEVLRDNSLMALNVLDACVEAGTERALVVRTSTAKQHVVDARAYRK